MRLASLFAGLVLGLNIGVVTASPKGGNIVAGEGSISTPDTSTTVIDQQSDNLTIDWTSFNVAEHELVQFNQPSATAFALNHIYDQNPSQIFGTIKANGNILLVNPNGIFFGPTASVDVNSLVASSLNITTEDFMAGNYNFEALAGSEGGLVVNQGLIAAATGGSVSLLGGAVKNEGVILATAGQITLAAGNKMTMDFDGDGLIQFTVDEGVLENAYSLDAAVKNSGEISADGGSVLLTGRAARDIFANVVNNEGIISAGRIENQGGVIKLVADGPNNSLINTGSLDVSGTNGDGGVIEIHADDTVIVSGDSSIEALGAGGSGGHVHILGDKVGILDNATIDVSGELGGGEVLIGGDYQGSNPDIKNASFSYVGADTSIKADAITNGDGGKVILWANNTTRFFGEISATGGSQAGDGGFVEVSGFNNLIFNGLVNAGSENGNNGTILLDPQDLTIQLLGLNDALLLDSQALFAEPDTATNVSLSTSVIELLTGNITFQAHRDLFINNALNLVNQTSGESVTFQAGRDLQINSSVVTAGGDLIFIADDAGGLNGGTGTLTIGAAVGDSTTGAITFTNDGSGGTALNNAVTSSSTITFNSAVTSGGAVSLSTGAGTGDILFGDTLALGGQLDITAGTGNVSFTGAVTNGVNNLNVLSSTTTTVTGGITGTTGSIDVTAATTDVDGAIALSGAGTVTLDNAVVSGVNITTVGGDIIFGGAVSLDTGVVQIDSGAGAGNILFSGDLDGSQALDLTAGSANIIFNGAVGSSVALGAMTINSAVNVTASSTIDAASLTQTAGSGTTTFNGDVTTAGVIDITANAVNIGGLVDLTGAGVDLGAVTAGITLTGANGETSIISSTGDANTITLANLSATNNPNLSLRSDGDLALSNTINIGTGTLQVNIDNNNSGGGAALTLGNSINAGTINLTGSADGGETLVTQSVDSTFTINGANAGTLANLSITGAANAGFSNFANLTGNTGDDTFIFGASGSLTGSINGAAQSVADTIDISSVAGAQTINLQSGTITTILGGTFSNIESFIGDNSNDLLSGTNSATTWTVSSANDGTLSTGFSFTNIANLAGGTSNDSFILSGGTLSGSVNGGGGTDTLTGDNVANSWTITGTDSGNATGVTGGFSSIENLTGGSNTDTFDFNGGAVSGNINGQGGSDTLDYATLAGPVSVSLTGTGTTDGFTGTASNISGTFDDIDNLIGSAGSDTLTGINAAATWTIDGTNSYVSTNTLNFSGIENLTGNGGVDTFNLTVSHTGNLSGAGSNDVFNLLEATVLTGNLLGGSGDDTFNFNNAGDASKTARITGGIDGGTGSADSIDFADSSLVQTITITGSGSLHGQQGSISGTPALLGNGFDNIDIVTGNSSGTITGPDANTFWNITGTNSGTFGTGSLANIGDFTFNNFAIQGGNLADTFVFQSGGEMTGGIDGGGGVNTLTGSLGADTFTITGTGSVDLTVGGLTTSLVNITHIDGSNATDDGVTTIGDSGADIFNINNSWSGSLNGGDGNNSFIFANGVTVGGSLIGGVGSDTLDWNLYNTARSVVLTNSDANGFDGNEASISGGFIGIDHIKGSTSASTNTLQGEDLINTWTVTSADAGSITQSSVSLTFQEFENLTGGSSADTFSLTAALTGNIAGGAGTNLYSLNTGGSVGGSISGGGGVDTFDFNDAGATVTGTITGGAGTDILDYADAAALGVTVNLQSNSATNTGGISGIETFIGDSNNDTLIGANAANNWAINGTNDGSVAGFSFTDFNNLQGGSAADAFNFSGGSITGTVNGGPGIDIITGGSDYNVTGADSGTLSIITGGWSAVENLTGTTGNDSFIFTAGSLSGTATGLGGNDLFAFSGGTVNAIAGGAGLDILDFGNAPALTITISGSDASGFSGNDGNTNITTGFSGIDTIVGSLGVDTLIGQNTTATFNVNSGDDSYNIGGQLLTLTNFENFTGGTGNDTFNINGIHTGDLLGGSGGDTFNLNGGSLTGTITGGAGSDTVTGGTSYDVTGVNSGTVAAVSGDWSGIENLTGTSGSDTFIFTAGSLSGTASGLGGDDLYDFNGGIVNNVNGQGGSDTLDFADTVAQTIVVTGTGSIDGFTGSATSISGSFNNINTVIGSSGTDTLAGDIASGGTFAVTAGGNTYVSTNSLVFSSIENLIGGPGADTFNINSAYTGNLNGLGGNDAYTLNGTVIGKITDNSGDNTVNIAADVTGGITTGPGNDIFNFNAGTLTSNLRAGAGNNIYNFNGGDAIGTITISGNDTWNHATGVSLGSKVSGAGSLTVPNAGLGDLTIGATDLLLPDMTLFSGHLIIGGTITPPTLPLDGNSQVTVNTSLMTVNSPIITNGDISLLAGDINLNNNISAAGVGGGQVTMLAVGDGTAAGDITGLAIPTTIAGGSALFITTNTIQNAENIELKLGGGDVQIIVGQGQADPAFGLLDANSIDPTAETQAFLDQAQISIVNQLGVTNIILGTGVQAARAVQAALAGNLIALQQLGFVDIGLFEEELSLFGIIGNGIALALAQCEELEGCAPNVAPEELDQIIEALQARIEELELRLRDVIKGNLRKKFEQLITNYRKELENFIGYKKQLKEYYTSEDELEEELEDKSGVPEITSEVETLSGILKVAKQRIEWLKSLKDNSALRERLSRSTGVELTIEALEQIIEATRREIESIEAQIKLLLKGTQARLHDDSPGYQEENASVDSRIIVDETMLAFKERLN